MTPEQIRQEAEREYPIDPLFRYLERLVNSTNRKAYIKGRMKSLEEKEKEIAELKEQVQIYQIASDSFADDADKLDEKLRQKTNDTLELVQALKDIRQGKINFADLDLLIKKYNL